MSMTHREIPRLSQGCDAWLLKPNYQVVTRLFLGCKNLGFENVITLSWMLQGCNNPVIQKQIIEQLSNMKW